MTAPTVYRSDDASAPQINGTVGSIIAALDAILVNGYGAKSAAGWTKPYTDTNKAAYYMGTGGTSDRMYLRVDDSAAQVARVVGYVTMSDIDTGVEPFPTAAQFSGGLYLHKSSTANATARPWIAFATPTTIYLFIEAGGTTLGGTWQTAWGQLAFGEYATYVGSFTKNVMMMAGSSATISQGAPFGHLQATTSGTTAQAGHYLARQYTDSAGATPFLKDVGAQYSNNYDTAGRVMGITNGPQVPSPVTGKIKMRRARIWTIASAAVEVGHLLGVWSPLAASYLGNNLDTIDGSGTLAAKTFMRVTAAGSAPGSSNVQGQCCIDLTDFD
jgi:hypothetical protein